MMNIRFINPELSFLDPSTIPPPALTHLLIPYTACIGLDYTEGDILLQQRSGIDTDLYYFTAIASHDHTVSYDSDDDFIGFIIALQSNYHLSAPGLENSILPESSFNVFYIPSGTRNIQLLKGHYYRMTCIRYPIHYLQQLSIYFPVLQPFMKEVTQGKAVKLDTTNRIAGKEILDIIDLLLYTSFPGGEEQYHFYQQAKSQDLLLQALLAFSVPPTPVNRILKTADDYEIVYQLKHFMETNISQRPTYRQLCKMAGWNKDKLQKGFRQVYNMSVMECYQDLLMIRARKMIQSSNTPIKEIAHSLGYEREYNFTRAYIRYFGSPPTADR